MAQAYSDDLRCKLLEAYEAGAGSLRQLAAQFRVNGGTQRKFGRSSWPAAARNDRRSGVMVPSAG